MSQETIVIVTRNALSLQYLANGLRTSGKKIVIAAPQKDDFMKAFAQMHVTRFLLDQKVDLHLLQQVHAQIRAADNVEHPVVLELGSSGRQMIPASNGFVDASADDAVLAILQWPTRHAA